jgi:site-specific DNA-methyltransferase (adenine-specific)
MIIKGDWRQHINSVDTIHCVITDPPYNVTGCEWDGAFTAEEFWQTLTPKLADECVVILTAQMRIAVEIINTATIDFRHELVWEKPNGTGQVRYSPNRCHELVLVFGKGTPYYNPQMIEGKPYTWNATRSKGEASGYKGGGKIENTGTRHPRSVLKIKQERGLHPTQKPVELMEFLIASYTKPEWCVYDFFGGSGTTGVAARNLNRKYWICEQDQDYYNIIEERLK